MLLPAAIVYAESPFDESRRVVLPSKAATQIFKVYLRDDQWSISEWPISSKDLDAVEGSLASAFAEERIGLKWFKARRFYRQYMPARWKEFHVIVVNGFYESPSETFPDKGIAPDLWKHQLVIAFGGGCGFWHAVYIVEQSRFIPLDGNKVLCNGEK